MAVFRVNRTRDYTVMANFHLRDKSLSLKAKGLLSLMLSLPEDWDYTTRGLASICKDGLDGICATLKELEKHGYLQRHRRRDSRGRLTDVEYIIQEKPIPPENSKESPKLENPDQVNPDQAKPHQASPYQENPNQAPPHQENPTQLNIQELNKQKSNTDLSNTHSFSLEPSFTESGGTQDSGQTDGMTDVERVRKQIEYPIMAQRYSREQLDELVQIILEVYMNRSPTLRLGRDAEYPTAFVQERFRKINAMHIERVMDGIQENRTRVYNTKAYLLTALFNSVSTLDTHYAMRYNADCGIPDSY